VVEAPFYTQGDFKSSISTTIGGLLPRLNRIPLSDCHQLERTARKINGLVEMRRILRGDYGSEKTLGGVRVWSRSKHCEGVSWDEKREIMELMRYAMFIVDVTFLSKTLEKVRGSDRKL
jgi:hypothetical protein